MVCWGCPYRFELELVVGNNSGRLMFSESEGNFTVIKDTERCHNTKIHCLRCAKVGPEYLESGLNAFFVSD